MNPDYAAKLANIGIVNVEQILKAGKTQRERQELSDNTGIPIESILEFVKLADLSRIGAVKRVRARLYYDAGIDTVEKMAQWNPKELREFLLEFVKKTGFNGIATLPKEAENAIKVARKLPKIVEY